MSVMIDRANVNAPDNEAEARRHGVRWAYLKATEGLGFTDATYHGRLHDCHAANIVAGAYMFTDNRSAAGEVRHFLDVIADPAPGQLRPCLDAERSSGGVPSTGFVVAAVEALRRELGYWPTLYGSTSVIGPMRRASMVVRACPYWRAEYGPNDGRLHSLQGGASGAAAHQYTSVGHIAGVNGATDVSVMLRPDMLLVPHPAAPKVLPAIAWKWARWRMGLGEYHGHGSDPDLRPRRAPRVIPLHYWRAVRWYKRNVIKPERKRLEPGLTVSVEPPEELLPDAGWVLDGNGKPWRPPNPELPGTTVATVSVPQSTTERGAE